jgi:transposase
MSTQRFSPEFKEEAVRQVVNRGYSVAEVSARLVRRRRVYDSVGRPTEVEDVSDGIRVTA